MSQGFTSDAKRLAGVTCRALSWRPEDFWSATPAEVATIFTADAPGEDAGLSRREMDTMMELDRDG